MAKKIYIGNMLQEMQSAIAALQSDMATMSTDMAGMVSQLTDIGLNTVQSIGSLKVNAGTDKLFPFADIVFVGLVNTTNTGSLLSITKPKFKCLCEGLVRVTIADLTCEASCNTSGKNVRFKLKGIIDGVVVAEGVLSDPATVNSSWTPVSVSGLSVDIPVAHNNIVEVGLWAIGSYVGTTSLQSFELSNISGSYDMVNLITDGALIEV